MKNNPVKGVVFDLDGTLINSEDNYRTADEHFFARRGISFTDAHYKKVLGLQSREIIKWIKSEYGISGAEDDLLREKEEGYLEIARQKTTVYPEMHNLLKELASRNIPMAVATGSPPEIMKEMLRITKIEGFFSAAVSSVDAGKPKPAPDVYTEAVRRLRLKPGQCVALEDSPYGVASALAAGLRCVGIPTITNPLDPVFDRSDMLVRKGITSFLADDFLRRYILRRDDPLSIGEADRFIKKVYDYYRNNRRGFPWRETRNPYHIFVSEIMLQQTQVERGIKKYHEFLSAFPDFFSLASAPLGEVYRVWRGLGYNRRARYLKESAEIIGKRRGGVLPPAPLVLKELPGVGPATAGAIAAYAFDIPSVFIETNIRRAVISEFFPQQENVPDLQVISVLNQVVDRSDPRNWYYALTDYGAALGKTGSNPNRRSAAYTRQSSFQGSFRQLRGQILFAAARKGEVRISDFLSEKAFKEETIKKAFRELQKEGFLKQSNGAFKLT